MFRKIYSQLQSWKNSPTRMPLLLRGARQTGKTYIIEAFGKKEFDNLITINFELEPKFKSCFIDLNPQKILPQIELLTNQSITLGKTLLFLDEVQECPDAIQSLRYFKEQLPQLHVMGAGSLLEFTLNDTNFRMPVGRIEFMYLHPLTFWEFLCAINQSKLANFLKEITLQDTIPTAIHDQLLEYLNLYLFLGGMPAIIEAYRTEHNLKRCQQIQAYLLNTYRNDFGKYASLANQQYCQKIFEKAPYLVSQQFKYVDVDPEIQSRSLKQALSLLVQAGLIYQVFSTQANGLPLNATLNEKKFKLLFLDVGLVKYATYLSANALIEGNALLLNHGQIAEQFVGQELIAYQPFYRPSELYFWEKSSKTDSAEIDYVTYSDSNIIPIEVKAGKTGRLRSLNAFIKEKNSIFGIKVSQNHFAWDKKILSLPLYLLSEIDRLSQDILNMS